MQEHLHRRNREETGGPLFCEHLQDAEQNNTEASKPVVRHFNLPNHSHSLHQGNTQSRKTLEQKLIFNWVHSLHTESMNASHYTNLFTNSCDHIFSNGKAPLHSYKPQQPTIPLFALTKG